MRVGVCACVRVCVSMCERTLASVCAQANAIFCRHRSVHFKMKLFVLGRVAWSEEVSVVGKGWLGEKGVGQDSHFQ